VRAVLGVVAVLLLVGVATFVAGERIEVARLRTFDERGVVHETKLWVVDQPDGAWVRVARPERQWLQRLRKNPEIEIVRRDAAPLKVRATPDPSTDTKARIDRAFREKYGIVDWWYGLLLRSNPIPVRLEAAPPG
jgi:hypothetical protein